MKIGDYDIQLVLNEHLPTLIVVASHIAPENQKNKLIRTPSDITKLYFVDLTEENIFSTIVVWLYRRVFIFLVKFDFKIGVNAQGFQI